MIINTRHNSTTSPDRLRLVKQLIIVFLQAHDIPATEGRNYLSLIEDDVEEFGRFAAWQLAHNNITIHRWRIGISIGSGFEIVEDKHWTAYMLKTS